MDRPTGDTRRPRGHALTNRRLAWLVGLAAVLALLAVFVADNFVLTEVRVFTTTYQVRLAWALVIAFGLGAVAGFLAAKVWRR